MSNKGQVEIFGLVIIVILISLGLLFAVFILTKEPTREIQRVKESIQAANFLNTMRGTTSIGCGRRTVIQLLQDCALSGPEWANAALCDNKLTSTCEMADGMISQMLDETLGKWGKDYRFFINGTEAIEQIKTQSGDCEGEREGSTKAEKVRQGLDIVLTLHICQS